MSWAVSLANFEALIRDALAKQDASNPQVRGKIYHSSRNALQRMIAKAPNASPQAVDAQRKALEVSISKIEADYASPRPTGSAPVHPAAVRATRQSAPGQVAPSQSSPTQGAPTQSAGVQQAASSNNLASQRQEPEFGVPASSQISNSHVASDVSPNPRLNSRSDSRVDDPFELQVEPREPAKRSRKAPPPPELRRKRKWPGRLAFILVLFLFFIMGWLLYSVLMSYVQDYNSSPANKTAAAQSKGTYVSILTPEDTSGLLTSGRGKAEIIEFQNKKVIRLQSIRGDASQGNQVKPILMELQPGILEQVAGKDVVVEIRAKSGGDEPSQFSVSCDFGGEADACGRFRFRAGLQPEDMIFNIKFADKIDSSKSLYLAINTADTPDAAASGQGEIVDVFYARIRINDE